ncbi:uncharacterized protein F5Z01DRAFT_174070 [Emericellopsis atlantica]|uniref:Cell wall protein SED1 n=1 Tax=Emericellopsis atlantica TaxID=2614577 RepID=A0A9P8CN35_9HYPO|nr:uncharacterized protein F5Z01DRAFT_174070 [Emericellopsis atlantica]KAG9253078.1 hypothetical protein F5Z01DRAFT_174070 [Emericellopsis atlantica]
MIANMRLALVGALAGSAAAHQYSNTTSSAVSDHVTYTTETVTAITTYCPGPTTITHGTKTYTVTEETTLTITDCPCTITTPVTPLPTPTGPAVDECAAACTDDAFRKCQVTPGSNKSTCASNYAQCLGFNPFNNNGTLVEPTACSGTPIYTTETVTTLTTYCPEPTTFTHGTNTYTVTEPTTLTITDCPCTITHSVEPVPTTQPEQPQQPEPTTQPEQPQQPEPTTQPPAGQPETTVQPPAEQPESTTSVPPVEMPSTTPGAPAPVPGAANKVGGSAAALLLAGVVALL